MATIRKDKATGTWYISTTAVVQGKKAHCMIRGYATKGDAVSDMERAVGKWKEDHVRSSCSLSFSSLVDEYLAMRAQTRRKYTVKGDGYRHMSHCSELYGLPLSSALSSQRIERWYTGMMRDQSLSSECKNDVIRTMKGLLEFAYRKGYMKTDDYYRADSMLLKCRDLKSLVSQADKRIAYTVEEMDRILGSIPDGTMDKVMLTLFFFLGCRIGEFPGLTGDSIDDERHAISIKRQTLPDGTLTDALKTKESERTETLTEELYKEVREWADLNRIRPLGFLFFANTQDRPMSRMTFRRRLYIYEDKAGVKRNVPHGLRNTQVTLLLSKCENPQEIKVVAQRLGHSVTTCMNTYQRIVKNNEIDIISRAYGKAK